jgi:hypothetical protein
MADRSPKVLPLLTRLTVLGAAAVILGATMPACAGRLPAVAAVNVNAAPVSSLQATESASKLTDARGGHWVPDRFSYGGSLAHSNTAIGSTASPALYRDQRRGIRGVTVPLRANGSYLVVLYFAETGGAAPGKRVFDVLAQGRQVATVDIARDVAARTPFHLSFKVSVPRRRLAIRFVARRGTPVLSAIQVRPVDPHFQLPGTRLAFDDEFDGPRGASPDRTKWTFDTGPGWNQASDYTDRPANASLDGNGSLLLSARTDPYADPNGHTYTLTSARMTTKGLYAMRYGLAEARIRVTGQPGFVSTFWALRTDVDSVGWPQSGEIDPEEVRGVQPDVLTQAFHMPCGNKNCPVVWDRHVNASLANGFHTFAFEWAPGVVIYYLDGRQTASLTAADVPRGAWVFDKPFYLILNLIVGGGWAGNPLPATHWPVTMKVDWVRVFS